MSPKSSKLKQAFGNWVTGDRFWNRDDDIASFMQYVEQGAHLYMVAQRRMGKTSLMREVAERLKDKYICLFVDFQKAKDAPDAIKEISLALQPYKNLKKKMEELFANILGCIDQLDISEIGIKLRAGLSAGNWPDKGDKLFKILANADKPVLLLFDEVPILVNRMLKGDDFVITPERRKQADEFMSWLRKNSQAHQKKIRIVLTGSIGFEPVLHQANLTSTINNFIQFELKPWPKETAVACLEALANESGVVFDEDVPAEIVKKLGCCIPHHVQMFFTHINDRCKRKNDTRVTKKDVNEIYQKEMLGTHGLVELTHYEERLQSVLDAERLKLAVDMLSEAAVTGKLTREALSALQKEFSFPDKSAADVQQEILQVLLHDGYLEQKPSGYVFISKLLRDWWKKRYENFFTPILERGA